jgi:hypothetical protein
MEASICLSRDFECAPAVLRRRPIWVLYVCFVDSQSESVVEPD